VQGSVPAGTGTVRTVARAVLPARTRRWIYLRRETTRRWAEKRRYEADVRHTLLRHLRPTDVYIVGHTKSGNTWLAYMLAVLLRKDRDGRVRLKNVGDYIPNLQNRDGAVAQYRYLPNPRIFRNETPLHADLLPKVVYIVRDPRAVLVSYYHMYRTLFGDEQTTLAGFVREYLRYGCVSRWEPFQISWDRQVLAWTKQAQRGGRVLVVKYEDMVRDRRSALERVARFAGVPYAEEDLALAVVRGSFEAMRRDEEEHGAEAYDEEQARRGRFIRRGRPDGWKDELTPDVAMEIQRKFARAMEAAGYR
jgi:hypothetical protein